MILSIGNVRDKQCDMATEHIEQATDITAQRRCLVPSPTFWVRPRRRRYWQPGVRLIGSWLISLRNAKNRSGMISWPRRRLDWLAGFYRGGQDKGKFRHYLLPAQTG
jgi:hypothetical protein